MKVLLGETFQKHFLRFPHSDQMKIFAFIAHVEQYGFAGLSGRNKPSHNVPTNHPNWLERVQHAQDNNLWHYHIGIPNYAQNNPHGDWTSEYVLHYVLGDDFIKIVDMSPHPPLILPDDLD